MPRVLTKYKYSDKCEFCSQREIVVIFYLYKTLARTKKKYCWHLKLSFGRVMFPSTPLPKTTQGFVPEKESFQGNEKVQDTG